MTIDRKIAFCATRSFSGRSATLLSTACGAVLLAALISTPVHAGVGVSVALDLPSKVKSGTRDLAGTITVANINNFGDADVPNRIYGITLTPSCATRSIDYTCPNGFEEPHVFAVDPVAIGRPGSACEGVVFNVSESDVATGEVEFNPPDGYVLLAPSSDDAGSQSCIIDFSLNLTTRPAKNSNPSLQKAKGFMIETTAYAGALAVTEGGMRPGTGGNMKTLEID